MLSGRYPPATARGTTACGSTRPLRLLAERFAAAGFATAAFVARVSARPPLRPDRGLQTYGDAHAASGRRQPATNAPGTWSSTRRSPGCRHGSAAAVSRAVLPLDSPLRAARPIRRSGRRRPASARYDEEIAEATGRSGGCWTRSARIDATPVVVDRGSRRGVRRARRDRAQRVRLRHDAARAAGRCRARASRRQVVGRRPCRSSTSRRRCAARRRRPAFDADGVDLRAGIRRPGGCRSRELYAESFAPLLDFGWSPLRDRCARTAGSTSPRRGRSCIDVAADPAKSADLVRGRTQRARRDCASACDATRRRRWSRRHATDAKPRARLQSLGIRRRAPRGDAARAGSEGPARAGGRHRARHVRRAARAPSSSARCGEILADGPGNPQAHCASDTCCSESGRCAEAIAPFQRRRSPAACPAPTRTWAGPAARRRRAASTPPRRRCAKPNAPSPATPSSSQTWVSCSPTAAGPADGDRCRSSARCRSIREFHEARFNLAIAYARAGPARRRGAGGGGTAAAAAPRRAAARGSPAAAGER